MRDARQRALGRGERTPANEAELLQERLRTGELSLGWLEVGARLGDALARKVLGRFVRVEGSEKTLDLLPLAHEVSVRVALEVAAVQIEAAGKGHERTQASAAVRGLLDAVKAWSREPSPEGLLACEAARGVLEQEAASLAAERDRQVEIRGQIYERQAELSRIWPRTSGDETYELSLDRDQNLAELGRIGRVQQLQRVVELAERCARGSGAEAAALVVVELDSERRLGIKRIRELLAVWALSPGRASVPPPEGWSEVVDSRAGDLGAGNSGAGQPGGPGLSMGTLGFDEDEPEPLLGFVFQSSLEDKAVKKEATALRKRIKELHKDLVALAALCGDPASWLVAKPEGFPKLEVPSSSAAMNEELVELIAGFAKDLPRDEVRRIQFLQRLRDPESTSKPGPVWPDWARSLVARLALAIGDTLLPLFEAEHSDQAAPRIALEAARAFHLRPRGDAELATARAKEATKAAGRRTRRANAAKSAGRAVGWATELVVRVHHKARRPQLNYANRDLLAECLAAGLEPQALWDLIRTTAIDWALGEDDLGLEARPYSPRESFVVGEVLQHSRFGQGKVMSARGKKIEVEFPEGRKTLVHAG